MLCPLTRKYCERKCNIGKCFIIKRGIADAKRALEGTERRKDQPVLQVSTANAISANDYYQDV